MFGEHSSAIEANVPFVGFTTIVRTLAEMANTNGGFGKIAISAAGKFEKKSSNYIEERL